MKNIKILAIILLIFSSQSNLFSMRGRSYNKLVRDFIEIEVDNISGAIDAFILESNEDISIIFSKLFKDEYYYFSYNKMSEIIKAFVRNGVNLDLLDSSGQTELMREINYNFLYHIDKINKVRLLIENGADVNKVDNNGMTALAYAIIKGNISIVDLLIENGAYFDNVNVDYVDDDEVSLLMRAIIEKNNLMVDFLIKNGADVNKVNKNGITALGYAITEGDTSIVDLLIENSADINHIDNFGLMALTYAIIAGNIYMVRFLIGKYVDIDSIDVNYVNHSGVSLLMNARIERDTAMVDFLIDAGATE